MISISAEHISLEYGTELILRDVSFQLNDGEKMGVVGVNGAGKSTLFHIICQKFPATTGDIGIAKGKTVGILEQNGAIESENNVFDEMLLAFQSLMDMEERLFSLQSEIEDKVTISGSEEYENLVRSFTTLTEQFQSLGGLTFRNRTRSILKSMGFGEEMWNLPVSALSGGQKTRLALVRQLLREPDILLLDEPTNHLDMDTMVWLETYLKSYRKTVIVISHDRYFLDHVTGKILEIERGISTLYNGNYTNYVRQKKENREILEKHYNNQQKEIKRIEAYIEQQRRWNRERNIIAAESRQKMLDRMEKIEAPSKDPGAIRLQFSTGMESGNDVLTFDGLSKSYDGTPLFNNVSLELKKRDRVFLCGPNGCGKSTLLKIIAGKVKADSGECIFGSHVHFGYYDQEQQELHDENTVMEELWSVYSNLTQTEIRNTLALFQFHAEDMEKKVRILSGGEKARLTLAKLVLSNYNMLILDEPTNHLDIPSREVLENALSEYKGTLIAVSHDRYFISKLATRILDFDRSKVLDYPEDYESFRKHKEQKENKVNNEKIAVSSTAFSKGKETYIKNKEAAQLRRRDERQLQKARETIPVVEDRITEIDCEICGEAATDYVRLSALSEEKQQLEDQLLELYETEDMLSKKLDQD